MSVISSVHIICSAARYPFLYTYLLTEQIHQVLSRNLYHLGKAYWCEWLP